MISVIIATKNRSTSLTLTIQSLIKNVHSDWELIIVDQSTDNKTYHVTQMFPKLPIQYMKDARGGKSHALNLGINRAVGNVLAFTDDDCIVSKNWLATIQKNFNKYPSIAAMFGNTYPYKPKDHPRQTCPCTFLTKSQMVITKPCLHYANIGFGNNMAVRKNTLRKIGPFKPWLGPGSIGSNAEDAEFALRILRLGYSILRNPQMVAYHNKWLNEKEMQKQQLSYTCGEMACYGYLSFQGEPLGSTVVLRNIKENYYSIKKIRTLEEMIRIVNHIAYQLRGLFVGFFYSLSD